MAGKSESIDPLELKPKSTSETRVDWFWVWVTPEYMSVGLGSIKLTPKTRIPTRIYVKLHNYLYVYISVKLRFFTHSFTSDTTSF
jgi:hypothetical protein